jgi:VanZ family protein
MRSTVASNSDQREQVPNRLLRLAWLIALVVVIVGSLLPARSVALQVVGRVFVSDKLEHFTAYAILAGFPVLDRSRFPRWYTVAAFLFLLGVALEFTQKLVPGRSCDWHDGLANTVGILSGMALARALPLCVARLSKDRGLR